MNELRHRIADDFRHRVSGKLEETKITEITQALLSEQDAFPAEGEVVSMIFYLKFLVNLTTPPPGEQPTFRGSGGGISSPGGGVLFGDVYTDDLGALQANTTNFEFNLASAYSSLLFFDDDSNLLGHFESTGISTVLGIGGGTGVWDIEVA